MGIEVVEPGASHQTGWRGLWDAYCGGAISAEVGDATWRRLLDPASSIGGLVAVCDADVVAFVTYVEHECTWELKPVCYVEDVFVAPLHRGRDSMVARSMAANLLARLASAEWSRLYGITALDNVLAQRLYSTFSPAQACMRYVIRSHS